MLIKMYKNKKDVDIHVEKLMSKLSLKDFKSRAYSFARLYFDVGDYESCQKYVEQYLTFKPNNAAAHKLLGHSFQKTGFKDKALEQFKISLDLDPSLTSIILDICELLLEDDISIDIGRAKYWCEKAEVTFPKHPATFKLREKLLTVSDPDPEAIIKLLTSELLARPKDVMLHCRLLKHYLNTNKVKEAFDHSCKIEFGKPPFLNNVAWYDILSEVLKQKSTGHNDWLYQLLLLTVRERLCMLSLTEIPQGQYTRSISECTELLYDYDQSIGHVSKSGPSPGFAEFHASLLKHHRGQLIFLSATLILKKAKKDQLNWHDASKFASLLMLSSWQIIPMDPNANWLNGAPENQKTAVIRWWIEGAYRCSQAGYFVFINNQDKSQLFLNQISQFCSGTNWKDKLYDIIFASGEKKPRNDSYFISNLFNAPALRLPRKIEIQVYDIEAQKQYPNSLHHFVWILSKYNNFADFKCAIFDMLSPTLTTCGPESLNKLDILAFLYSATLTAQKQNDKFNCIDVPPILPANISNLLCTLPQIKWWDCAYKFSQNELGTEYTDIRSTLSQGIEVVRCIDNHGLDPELLCILGRTFSKLSSLVTIESKDIYESRAKLYYSSAIPLLEKLKNKSVIKLPPKRLFAYSHSELDTKDLNSLLEESKLFIALMHYNECEYAPAIELLSTLRTANSYYYLSESYRKLAEEEKCSSKIKESNSKYISLLGKAKHFAFKSLEMLKENEDYKTLSLYNSIQECIDNIESCLSKVDTNISMSLINDGEGRFSSDENVSELDNVIIPKSTSQFSRNLSSTPKQPLKQLPNMNSTNYRTALDSHVFDNTQIDQQFLERIEKQIKHLQKRDASMEDFMEQTKNWFDENRKLGNQIINTIHSNIENTTEQFKLLKISVDQVKDNVAECRTEYKDVAELKKQIAELKKEVNKLKKSTSEQAIDESDLYNLDDEYRTNENSSTFGGQVPFATPQVMPPFTQRLVPPFPVPANPYHLYGQNLYNLYNQYSQLTQNSSVPGAPTLFEPNRASVQYPGVYQTPDQMFLDVANLVQPTIPPAPAVVPTVANIPTVSTLSTTVISAPSVHSTSNPNKTSSQTSDVKISARPLPVNVVITSSDPLPTCTNAPAPILSVTIPQKHIKGSPHNYQISMPLNTETKSIAPPTFSFPSSKSATPASVSSASSNILSNWSKFNSQAVSSNQNPPTNFLGLSNDSKNVVDGALTSSSPNTSLNKSRTLSERSNTSIDNYDPCPDFKPIIPLPAEIKVTTGEENETAVFCARAKLFRFTDKQWKERGIGEMKLLKHNTTGKVRVLMRREQVHKICANHIIVPEMEIKPMKNETKAYFWVANDFAEETVILEKFCIRFKSADIAKNFYDTFEKARLASVAENDTKLKEIQNEAPVPNISTVPVSSNGQSSKTVVGGFTFNSTPSFKIVADDTKTETKTVEPAATKVSVFSGLTFKTNTSTPFSSVFNNSSSQNTYVPGSEEKSSKLNTSDNVEEFEPTVEFKPVVPLPALVDQKTGEEDEIILFEHRAKLLRFDSSTKEWKERGLGNIKLLANKDNKQKLRLLMRREQIMKVCCNHTVNKDMSFQKMPNMDKAVTWCANDFSDGELVPETFCLRFKTVQVCDEFIEAVKAAQLYLREEVKSVKEEKNVIQQNTNNIGFGAQFKQKPGSWECKACYTNNLENFEKCACCETPKPVELKQANNLSWGDRFKPKAGTWECKQCLIRNEPENVTCSACNSAKDSELAKTSITASKESAPKFNFGISASSTVMKESNINTSVSSGWGDKFKPKEGTWECKQCFVRNEKTDDNCSACNSSRDPLQSNTEIKSLFPNTSLPKFTFGIPQKASVEQKNAPAPALFNTNASQTFKFGISQSNDSGDKPISEKPYNNSLSSLSKVSTDSETVVNLSIKKNDSENTPKPALLPTPTASTITFGSKQGGTFDFAFKPKSPAKGKSPVKSPKSVKGDESGDDEYASEDEGAHIHFSPVIPMPDKIEVVTGEEHEEEIYAHRAKLFMFSVGEWKERGIGIVKILKHKDTGKLRVLMRREQVHKICLNHILSPDIIYKPKDEKTWYFAANDYSEGEIQLQQFCLRFQNKAVAQQFKQGVDEAIKNKYGVVVDNKNENQENESDDVIFVSEIQASAEEKQKAKDLMLPENFFTYKNKNPCEGCRGCENEIDEKSEDGSLKSQASTSEKRENTPMKDSASNLRSNSSIYGTPTALNKTIDSIFQTPLSALGSNNDNSLKPSPNNTLTGSKLMFGGSFNQQSQELGSNCTEEPTVAPVSFISSGFMQNVSSGAKSSILAAPKLSSSKTNADQQVATTKVFGISEPKTVFGSSENKGFFGFSGSGNLFSSPNTQKSIFSNSSGISTNSSIFKSAPSQTNNSEIKSVFSMDQQKPINLFTNSTKGGSIFGPTVAKANDSKPTFSFMNPSQSAQDAPKFGLGDKISTSQNLNAFNISDKVNDVPTFANLIAKSEKKPDEKLQAKDETLKIPDSSLSFAALSSSSSEFAIQKKPDFKWEGAGQQLFASAAVKEGGDGDKSGADAAADEEYDPHYEPIVPLPDEIVVTTGEEDEEKIFGERCKLYRYDESAKEWKERGVGEMKILYHSERKTYRMLLRREQVHKAVLNMLIFMDMELLPLKNSDRAWTWAGRNYADSAGEQETLAVRFKSVALATQFQTKVLECVRKLQVAAAEAIRKEKEASESATPFSSIPPLRLPKHLEDNARADKVISFASPSQPLTQSQNESVAGDSKPNGISQSSDSSGTLKQVHFEEKQENEDGEEDYEHDYDEHAGDSEEYYNEEEEEESAVYYACGGAAVVEEGGARTACADAHVEVLFDHDVCSPKILLTDASTGELLADMLIYTDTEFQIIGDTCTWSGVDYTRNTAAEKKVTVQFADTDTAMEFYDSCETSKASTYVSNDPES